MGRQDGDAKREAADASQGARSRTLVRDPCCLLSHSPPAFFTASPIEMGLGMGMGNQGVEQSIKSGEPLFLQ